MTLINPRDLAAIANFINTYLPTLADNNIFTGNNTFKNALAVGAATASGDAINLGQYTNSIGTSGYIKQPYWTGSTVGTFYIQWGVGNSHTVTAGNGTNDSITYPIAFPNDVLLIACSSDAPGLVAAHVSASKTGFSLNTACWFTTGSASGLSSYVALGY